MSAHGATRQRAFQTACTLAAAGKRPTIAAVREGLGGKGSQQAIGAGIDDWLDEAARRFQIPGIPEALRTQVVEVWDQACRLAGEQWDGAKTALEAQVSGLDTQLTEVTGELDAARNEIERLAAELNSQGTILRETQDALDLAGNTLAARTEALVETTEALAQARAPMARSSPASGIMPSGLPRQRRTASRRPRSASPGSRSSRRSRRRGPNCWSARRRSPGNRRHRRGRTSKRLR